MLSETKTNTKGQILYDSNYMRYPASSIHREGKQNRSYQRLGGKIGELVFNGYDSQFGDN